MVTNPVHTFSIYDALGHLAYGLVALSFLVRDIFWLRTIAVFASSVSITYNAFAGAVPMWVAIQWNIIFIALNSFQLFRILMEKRNVHFSPKEQELYDTIFSSFSKVEFMKVLKIAEWKKAKTDETLIVEGQKMENVFLIYNGRTSVVIKGKQVAELKDGDFIGEMSFITNRDATATVKVIYPTEYLIWNQKSLKELLNRNPSILFSLQKAMGLQLTQKLIDETLHHAA